MRTPGIAGISDIECPACRRTLHDYDPPEVLHGLTRVTARCHHCMTEQVLRIDHWRGETNVSAISQGPWVRPTA